MIFESVRGHRRAAASPPGGKVLLWNRSRYLKLASGEGSLVRGREVMPDPG